MGSNNSKCDKWCLCSLRSSVLIKTPKMMSSSIKFQFLCCTRTWPLSFHKFFGFAKNGIQTAWQTAFPFATLRVLSSITFINNTRMGIPLFCLRLRILHSLRKALRSSWISARDKIISNIISWAYIWNWRTNAAAIKSIKRLGIMLLSNMIFRQILQRSQVAEM